MQIEEDKWWSKLILPAVLVVLLLLMGGAAWWISRQITGTRREAPPVQTITLQPPPPPPPPVKPPEPKPAEPEKTIEEPKPVDKPQEAPPQQLTIAGPAQAGGDAFGIQSGSGQGRTLGGTPTGTGNAPGGSFGDSAYRRYMSSTLQQAMQSDARVNKQVFSAEVMVWVDRSGRVTRVSIARSSGNARTDQNIVAVLQGVRLGEPPNPAMRFPQRATVRGRKT